jgi:hypothetical protein
LRPSHSSHDWHVQPYCQRPNRLPPERRAFSPERIHSRRANLSPHYRNDFVCPRNLLNLSRCVAACQPAVPTGFPPVIHIRELPPGIGAKPPSQIGSFSNTQRDASSANRRKPKRKISNLKKDHLEVCATNAKTLRGTLSPNQNPVAGANFRVSISLGTSLDAGPSREFQNIRLATHCSRPHFYSRQTGFTQGQYRKSYLLPTTRICTAPQIDP